MKPIKNILLIFLIIFSVTETFADHHKSEKKSGQHKNHSDHKKHNHQDQKAEVKKQGKRKLIVKVKGMVCAFCAQGIEKNFNKRSEVKKTKVKLDTMEVWIILKKGKSLSEDTIRKTVKSAGFDFAGIK